MTPPDRQTRKTDSARPLLGLGLAAFILGGVGLYIASGTGGHRAGTTPGTQLPLRFRLGGPETGLVYPTVCGPKDPRDKRLSPEVDGAGIAIFDAGGDGWLDIYVLNGSTLPKLLAGPPTQGNMFYRNNRDGTFTEAGRETGLDHTGWAKAVAVGDIDNDGDPDIYIANLGPDTLLKNMGDGTWSDLTTLSGISREFLWTGACAFGDYDNDSHLDLYVTNYSHYDPYDPVMHGKDNKDCSTPLGIITCGPWEYEAAPDALYRNNGDGFFQDVTEEQGIAAAKAQPGQAVFFLDVDANGFQDIFVANDASQNFLFYNLGGVGFREVGALRGCAKDSEEMSQGTMGANYADPNSDGFPDILITNHNHQRNTYYLNNRGFFEDRTRDHPAMLSGEDFVSWGSCWQDLDCDGWLDLVIVNGETNPYALEQPEGYGTWEERPLVYHGTPGGGLELLAIPEDDALYARRPARGLSTGDLDRDGDMDMVMWLMDRPPVVLWNESPRGGFITLILEGVPPSNRDAYGTRVTLEAGGRRQVRWCHSDGSYYSAKSSWVHFGLGNAESADRVELRWPSGRVETLTDLAADRFYTLKEGEGVKSVETPVSGGP